MSTTSTTSTFDRAAGANATGSPLARGTSARLHKLFRASLREAAPHPLLRLMQAYRPDSMARDDASATLAALPGGLKPGAPGRILQPEQVKARVSELPPLPQAALRALATLRRDDSSLEDVAADLSCDASLTSRVLRLANSPFYGVPGRVSTVCGAAQVLGRRTLESVLTLAAVAGQFGKLGSKAFEASAFWRHALATAIAARALARAAGCEEDQAFVAGLLHDIGLLAMSVYFPGELDELILHARAADSQLSTVERALGLTPHAQVGGWIAAHWRFPAAVVQAIAGHHADTASEGTRATIDDCVHVANAVAHALDIAQLDNELVPAIQPAAWRRVAVADDVFLRIFEEAESGVAALCSALSL